MTWPIPTPTAKQLPPRLEGHPYSEDVLAFDIQARKWLPASYQFADVSGDAGSWEINGEVVDGACVSHWMPAPPCP